MSATPFFCRSIIVICMNNYMILALFSNYSRKYQSKNNIAKSEHPSKQFVLSKIWESVFIKESQSFFLHVWKREINWLKTLLQLKDKSAWERKLFIMNNWIQRRLNANFLVYTAIQGIKFQKMPVLDVLICNYESVICTLRRWMVIVFIY